MIGKLLEKYQPAVSGTAPQMQPSGIIEIETPKDSKDDVARHLMFNSWKDSAPVMRLSLYLKQHADQGIRLVLKRQCGRPCIQFSPGLKREPEDRWKIASNAISLFEEALPDLRYLLEHNLLALSSSDLNIAGG